MGVNSNLWRSLSKLFEDFVCVERFQSNIHVHEESRFNRLIILNDVSLEDIKRFSNWCNELDSLVKFDQVVLFSSFTTLYNDSDYSKRKLLLEDEMTNVFGTRLLVWKLPNLIFPESRWALYPSYLKHKIKIFTTPEQYSFKYINHKNLISLFDKFRNSNALPDIETYTSSIDCNGIDKHNVPILIRNLGRNKKVRFFCARYTPFFFIGGEEFIKNEG